MSEMNKGVVLYTTHCSKCTVLADILKEKKIPFSEVTDVETMLKKGFTKVPYLEVEDNNILDFKQALAWAKEK